METTRPTVSSIAVRYGLIVGFITVILSLILFMTDQSTNSAMGWLSYVIMIGGIFLAHREYKRENEGYMSYGQGLGIGTLIGAITGVLSGVFYYIYSTFVDPSFQERVREAQITELERRNMTDEQIDQAMAMTESFSGPFMMAGMAILGSIILAFLFSLVISALTRNSRPYFES